ncbi:acetyltransferase (GNAT) family protein [Aestuariispira insulae]|uniref:Acetyltransferase (GNAT) family protein n=2 Tax=Aestuariispira insulae TaxID=1461337 RepID=A0A3D9HSF5_9PROT|nr:acetyltransferase (GNAT) family protein [Aestuariispira insulae]
MLPVDDLAFEASFFGRPVWRLKDAAAAEDVVMEAREQGVGLISCRLPAGETGGRGLARHGFRLVETLVTLTCPVAGQKMPDGVSPAMRSEEEALSCAEIGAKTFKHDRFHADSQVDNAIADALKSAWVANAVKDRADCVLLYRDEVQEIRGFNACLFRPSDKMAIIDLIGIDPECQRQGIGSRLLQGMHAHYHGRADEIRLGTQLANKQSLDFYRRNGFQELFRQETWHWVPNPNQGNL